MTLPDPDDPRYEDAIEELREERFQRGLERRRADFRNMHPNDPDRPDDPDGDDE